MYFIVRCFYRPGGVEERLSIRRTHIDYMITHRHFIEQGGALVAADGESVVGMFLLFNVDSMTHAEKLLDDEPYTRAGLFEQRTIEILNRFIPHEDPNFLIKLRDCSPSAPLREIEGLSDGRTSGSS